MVNVSLASATTEMTSRFTEAFAVLGGFTPDVVASLVSELDAGSHGLPASSLNNDGFPFQACVTASDASRGLRLIADPAATEPDPERRLQRGLVALDRLLADSPGAPFREEFRHAIADCLPDGPALRGLRSGALWLAIDPNRRACAAYVTARFGQARDRWKRVLLWFERWVGRRAAGALQALQGVAEVASVGIEGAGDASPRAKVYFRSLGLASLSELMPPFSGDEALRFFLRQALGDRGVRRSGLVFSMSGPLGEDRITEGKVDVCAHCTPRAPREWSGFLDQMVEQQGVKPLGLAGALLSARLQPAFVGLGLTASGHRRLNVYLNVGPGVFDG